MRALLKMLYIFKILLFIKSLCKICLCIKISSTNILWKFEKSGKKDLEDIIHTRKKQYSCNPIHVWVVNPHVSMLAQLNSYMGQPCYFFSVYANRCGRFPFCNNYMYVYVTRICKTIL